MSKLADAIRAKAAADGVSPAAAARKVGLALPAFRAVLRGKSHPNARSLPKYAALLGISIEEVKALLPKDGAPAVAAGKPGAAAAAKGGAGKKAGARHAQFARLLALLEQAEALMDDKLAVAVHRLPPDKRRTIADIVNAFAS